MLGSIFGEKTDTNSAHAPPPAEGDLPPGRQETSTRTRVRDKDKGQGEGIRIRDKNEGYGRPPAQGD